MSITTCATCGRLYEAGSEEQANEPGRECRECIEARVARACGAVDRRRRDFRYLAFTAPASAEHFRAGAQRCGSCSHLHSHRKESAIGHCGLMRFQTRTDLAVAC